MADIGIPPTLPTWAKLLLQRAPWISIGLQFALDFIDDLHTSNDAVPTVWLRAQLVFTRAGETLVADKMITTFDFIHIVNGNVVNDWTQTDFDLIRTRIGNLTNGSMKAYWTPSITHSETRMYEMRFAQLPNIDPDTHRDRPFEKSGPPVAVYPETITGTAAGLSMIPQAAATTTDVTPYRRHWGRNYWPVNAAGTLNATGSHFTALTTDGLGAGMDAFYGGMWDLGYIPVTTVAQIDKQPARGLLTVNSIQVDDVPDVIRRRRPRTATHRFVTP